MNKKEVLLTLIQYDQAEINYILERAIKDYANKITQIAMDIYDSCIKQFYKSYSPVVYDRHGDRSGFNLYYANEIELYQLKLDIKFEPSNLLPYNQDEGHNFKRDAVLASVMKGIRARRSPRMTKQMSWSASYPNDFSRYSEWESSETKMNKIFDDFCKNIVNDTIDDFYQILNRYV